jgi:hypothetical protein
VMIAMISKNFDNFFEHLFLSRIIVCIKINYMCFLCHLIINYSLFSNRGSTFKCHCFSFAIWNFIPYFDITLYSPRIDFCNKDSHSAITTSSPAKGSLPCTLCAVGSEEPFVYVHVKQFCRKKVALAYSFVNLHWLCHFVAQSYF